VERIDLKRVEFYKGKKTTLQSQFKKMKELPPTAPLVIAREGRAPSLGDTLGPPQGYDWASVWTNSKKSVGSEANGWKPWEQVGGPRKLFQL